MTESSVEFRVLSEGDKHQAFGLVHQLRDPLDIEAFLRLAARQRALGYLSVFLDSRPQVLNFYSRLGYQPHTATLVRKRVGLSMLN